MEEKKVRRTIQFNDIEKLERFVSLYGDLFQNEIMNNRSYSESLMFGFEYYYVFHMNKENFEMLKKGGIVKKIRQASYKSNSMRCYKKDIWVLC